MLLLLATAAAEVVGGGLGFTGAMATDLTRPSWEGEASATNWMCGGIELRILDDHVRHSPQFGVCGGGLGNAVQLDGGYGIGLQTHGRVYVFADVDLGFSSYTLEGPSNAEYSVTSLMARPGVGVGAELGPVFVEVGPTIQLGMPMVTRFHNTPPNGRYHGHVTFGATVFFGGRVR
jgi:hypothetical protein